MFESLNFLKKIFLKSCVFRYFFLFYIMTFFIQILIAKESGSIPSQYIYDFFLFLNYTKEISNFILIMIILFLVEFTGKILYSLCEFFLEVFLKSPSKELIIIFKKTIVFSIFIKLIAKFFNIDLNTMIDNIHFTISKYEVSFLILFIIFIVEILAHSEENKEIYNSYIRENIDKAIKFLLKETEINLWFRIINYIMIIGIGIPILYKSLQ